MSTRTLFLFRQINDRSKTTIGGTQKQYSKGNKLKQSPFPENKSSISLTNSWEDLMSIHSVMQLARFLQIKYLLLSKRYLHEIKPDLYR